MQSQNQYHNGLKKIKVLESKIESLQRLKKFEEAHAKRRQLFHFTASFVSATTITFHSRH